MSNLPARNGYWAAALFAVIAAGAGFWGWQEHRRAADLDFTQHRVALLQSENTRLETVLAEQERLSAQSYEIGQRKPIEEAISRIRGLNFQRPVVYASLTRAGIKKIVEQKLSEEYSDEDFKNMAAGLSAFGLVEPGYPLKQKYIDLLGEQIAAFYDQHQHQLFMFEDASLHNSQNRVVLAHELTHALQDQNFGLLKMPLEAKNNDDLVLATASLVEGDATVAMSDFMVKNISMQALSDSLSGMLTSNMEQIHKSPRFLREMLMFPYLQGQRFCMALKARGGYQAISDAFGNPPTSSAQILHPEKYLSVPREDPIPIPLNGTAINGHKPLYDNVMGEMGIRIFLEQWGQAATAPVSAEGWRGDRYLVFGDGPDTELVWRTLWGSERDAEKFRQALLAALATRYGFNAADYPATGTVAGGTNINAKNRFIFCKNALFAGSNEVILIDATTNVWKDLLLQKFGTDGQN